MNCPRCKGLMVRIKLDDAKSTTLPESLRGWHCLLCGEVTDPGIEANRKRGLQPIRNRIRRPFGVMLQKVAASKPKKGRQ